MGDDVMVCNAGMCGREADRVLSGIPYCDEHHGYMCEIYDEADKKES